LLRQNDVFGIHCGVEWNTAEQFEFVETVRMFVMFAVHGMNFDSGFQ
jgi:hypothetical protein